MTDDERDDLEPDDPDEDDDLDDDDDEPSEPLVTIEIVGLSLYTHHGVEQAERTVGQRLVFDLSFDLSQCDATVTDRVEDTIDYGEVADIVALAATERSYRTLERLGQVIGERLIERFGSDTVKVRAAKPEPPLPLAIDEVAVEVIQERGWGPEDDEDEE
jgi:7,8-dihydroneopterin aldolase/epimerase/oxygenase